MKKIVAILAVSLMAGMGSVATAATWHLVDDFSGASVDTSLWDVTEVAPTSTVSIDSGRLHLYSPWYSSTEGQGAFVQLKNTLAIDDSEDVGVLSIAYDVEMGSEMSRSYGHYMSLATVADDIDRAEVLYYGGGDKDILLDNGPSSGSQWLEKNFQNQNLHFQLSISTSNVSYKIFNFQDGNTPVDYTDTTADLNDLTPGGLIASVSLSSGAGTSESLYMLLSGTTFSTSGGTGDIYFDNVYTSTPAVPEPATMALLACGLGGVLLRKRR